MPAVEKLISHTPEKRAEPEQMPSAMGAASVEHNARGMMRSIRAKLVDVELLGRTRCRTQAEARVAVFEFTEAWYNPRRRRSLPVRKPPNEFEKNYALREAPASAEVST